MLSCKCAHKCEQVRELSKNQGNECISAFEEEQLCSGALATSVLQAEPVQYCVVKYFYLPVPYGVGLIFRNSCLDTQTQCQMIFLKKKGIKTCTEYNWNTFVPLFYVVRSPPPAQILFHRRHSLFFCFPDYVNISVFR